MIENKTWFAVTAGVGAVVTALGGWDSHLVTLISLMAIDYVLGTFIPLFLGKSKKSANGKFETRVGFKGFVKKMVMIAIVYIAHRFDIVLETTWVSDVIIIGLICNEVLSIVEHAQVVGVKVPRPLLKFLAIIRKKFDDTCDEKEKGEDVEKKAIMLLKAMEKLEQSRDKRSK